MTSRRLLLLCGIAALALTLARAESEHPQAEEGRPGAWPLVASESRIYFIGIKNNEVPVPGSLALLEGALDVDARSGWIRISIASLDTGLAERDTNIKTHVFADAAYPEARFTTRNVAGSVTLPPIGRSIQLEATGDLELRGKAVTVVVPLRVSREGPARVRLQTAKPLVLTKEQLGLEEAFAVLQAVCGHEALSGAVPVQFDLLFQGTPPDTATQQL